MATTDEASSTYAFSLKEIKKNNNNINNNNNNSCAYIGEREREIENNH